MEVRVCEARHHGFFHFRSRLICVRAVRLKLMRIAAHVPITNLGGKMYDISLFAAFGCGDLVQRESRPELIRLAE